MLQPSLQFSGSYFRTPSQKELGYAHTKRISDMDRAAQALRDDIVNTLGSDIRISYKFEDFRHYLVIEKGEDGVFRPLSLKDKNGKTEDPYFVMKEEDTQNPVAFLKKVIARAKVLEQKDLLAAEEKTMIDAVKAEISGQVAPRVACGIEFAYANGLAETRNIIEAFRQANLDARLPERLVFVLEKNDYHDKQLEIAICRRVPGDAATQRPSRFQPTMGMFSDEHRVIRASRYTKFLAKILPASILKRFKSLETEESLSELIDRAVKRANVLLKLEQDVDTFKAEYNAAIERTANKFEMENLNFISAFGLQRSLEMLKALEKSMPSLNAISPDLNFTYTVDRNNNNQEHIFIGLGGSGSYRPAVLGLDRSEDFQASYVKRKRFESVDQFIQRALTQAKTLIQEKTKRDIELSQSQTTEAFRVS
jgi:hypothetical protein